MSDGQLAQGERRQRDADLDRIEDRFYDAPEGMHVFADGLPEAEVIEAGVPARHAMLWARWNGLQISLGGTEIEPAAQHDELTREALNEGLVQEGDRVIGWVGRDLLVLPDDPWEEGADVLLVGEDGQRGPYASTVERLVLAAMAESAVIYDEEGEYREEAFDEETGELQPSIRRQMVRRRLDMDPDAPLPRFELAQSLMAEGSAGAAAKELRAVIERAPNFGWAHHELGRALLAESGQVVPSFHRLALGALREAARLSEGSELRNYFLAWAALATDEGETRDKLVAEVLKLQPNFASHRLEATRELLEDGETEQAKLQLELGLIIAPKNLDLLALSRELKRSSAG